MTNTEVTSNSDADDGAGFNDARQIEQQTLLDYAKHLHQQVEQGAIGIATAQNRLSSVNRTMTALRGYLDVSVSTMPDSKRC